jgi:enhancer of yellow 2 transcription factor
MEISEEDIARRKQLLEEKLRETGEKEALIEYLRDKLPDPSRKADLRTCIRDIIRSRGLENVSEADLIAEVLPKARETVPVKIKEELRKRIRSCIKN